MKQTEIGLIPDDWEVIKILGNYFLKGRIGWQGLKASEFKDQGPYLVTGTDFVNGRVNWNTCYHISEKRYEEDKALHVREDDILITKDGTIGKVAYVDKKPEKVSLNSHLLIIRPLKDKLLNRYLYYILNSKFFYDYYQQTQTGTTMASLSQDKISKFVYPLPSKEEQQRIAKALSDVDSLISTTEKLIQKKKNIKQGTMQNLLTGKKRLPGFAKSTNYKQTELGPIPEDWEVKSIKDFAKVYDGTHQTPHYVDVGIPFYSVENVTANDFEHTKLVSEKEHRFLTSKVKIEKGDILMTRIGSIGDCKYIDWEPEASFYVSLALIKCDTSVDARFISYYSNSLQFKKELELRSLITAIPQKINLGPISEIILVLPPKKEQNSIAKILSDMDNEIDLLNTKLEKYRNLKTAMMQQLLTGKIRLLK